MKYFTDSPYERMMMEKPYARDRAKAAPVKEACGKCDNGAEKPCIAVSMRGLAAAGKEH